MHAQEVWSVHGSLSNEIEKKTSATLFTFQGRQPSLFQPRMVSSGMQERSVRSLLDQADSRNRPSVPTLFHKAVRQRLDRYVQCKKLKKKVGL